MSGYQQKAFLELCERMTKVLKEYYDDKEGYSTRQSTGRTRERWEDVQRSWDYVQEGEDGNLADTVEGLVEASKRKRYVFIPIKLFMSSSYWSEIPSNGDVFPISRRGHFVSF